MKPKQKPTKFYCKKCGYEWIDLDPYTIKCWCPYCNLIMYKEKK